MVSSPFRGYVNIWALLTGLCPNHFVFIFFQCNQDFILYLRKIHTFLRVEMHSGILSVMGWEGIYLRLTRRETLGIPTRTPRHHYRL